MTTPDEDLPEEIRSRIEQGSYDMELTQRHVALEFVHGDRPFYSVAQMHAALDSNVGDDTVRSRMDELDERDVVQSERVNNGSVYWLNEDDSEWPIPPDTTVEPKQDDMTVSEWQQQLHVQTAALSVLVAIIGTAITLIGVFQTGGYYQLPVESSRVIAYGLTMGILSYMGLVFAGLAWLFDFPGISNLREMISSEGEIR